MSTVVAEKPTTASSAKLVLYRLLARYLTALAARPLLLFIQETLSSRLSGSPKPALPAKGTALRSYVPIQVWGLLRELGVGEKNFQVCETLLATLTLHADYRSFLLASRWQPTVPSSRLLSLISLSSKPKKSLPRRRLKADNRFPVTASSRRSSLERRTHSPRSCRSSLCS
jgi:hypothetical protein